MPQPAVPLEATDAGREPAPGILHARLLRELLSHALPGMREGPAQDGQAGRRKPAHRPPNRCASEARKWPEKYGFGARPLLPPVQRKNNDSYIDSTGLKIGIAGSPPTAHCLRDWWWGDSEVGDLSLYDKNGTTIARLVLADDGRYHLRTPVTILRQSWADLNDVKRGAESFALMAMPLEAVDPKLAARLKRDNGTPHPMGPPVNRSRGAS